MLAPVNVCDSYIIDAAAKKLSHGVIERETVAMRNKSDDGMRLRRLRFRLVMKIWLRQVDFFRE